MKRLGLNTFLEPGIENRFDKEIKSIKTDITDINNNIGNFKSEYNHDMQRIFDQFEENKQYHFEEVGCLKEEIDILEKMYAKSRKMNFILMGIIATLIAAAALIVVLI